MTSMPPLSKVDSRPIAVQSPGFIPDSREELESELTRLAGHINAAQYRFLKLLAALIENKAWGGDSGIKTPAHWLNYYCGIDLGAAREKVRVAKALACLPRIDAAFASGAISYSKVRAMTRSATPANEARLLHVAKHGTAQHVETLVREHRRAKRLNETKPDREQGGHPSRELHYYHDEDGMLVVRGRFAPEEGAVLVKALEAAMDSIEQDRLREGDEMEKPRAEAGETGGEGEKKEQMDARNQAPDVSAETSTPDAGRKTFQRKRATNLQASPARTAPAGNVSAQTPERHEPQAKQDQPQPKFRATFAQQRADALARLAEHFLASGRQGSQTLAIGDKYQVFVHLDARSHSPLRQTDMPAHLDDGPALAESTFRRLACDASLVPVVRDAGGDVLNIGRKTRAVPPAIRRALKIRDGGCRYPGCCQTRYVDAHHIKHWCDGGQTSLDNLVLLCRYHHRLLHEGIFSIDKGGRGDNKLRFVDDHNKVIKPALYPQFNTPPADSGSKTGIERDNEQLGLAITTTTAITRWQGEQMDYDLAVDGLMRA